MKILDKPILSITGLECIRNDWSKIAKEMQKNILLLILEEKPIEEIKEIVTEYKKRVENLMLTLDEIKITQRIEKKIEEYEGVVLDKQGKLKLKKDGTPYKKAVPIHVKLAKRLIEQGETIEIGQKIEYVFNELEEPIGINEYKGSYSVKVYWDKKIYPPTFRVLSSAYPQIDWKEEFSIKKKKINHNHSLFDF